MNGKSLLWQGAFTRSVFWEDKSPLFYSRGLIPLAWKYSKFVAVAVDYNL